MALSSWVKSKPVRAARSAGAVAVFTAAVAVALGLTAPNILDKAFNTFPLATRAELQAKNTIQLQTVGPFMFLRSRIALSYPAKMREDQTSAVNLKYLLDYYVIDMSLYLPGGPISTDPPRKSIDKLDGSIDIELASSGFEVVPQGARQARNGEPLPIDQLWTITPKQTGDHMLLLTIREKHEGTYERNFSSEAEINGSRVQFEQPGIYKLPVYVNTYWGVSRIKATLVGAFFAFIGFVLSWDILAPLIRRLFRFPER